MNKKKSKAQTSASTDLYSVVKFTEDGCRMFECIWDGWFVDENRNRCYWPPSKGKNYVLRVLSKEIPDESWKICPCDVISSGHVTYKSGFNLVKEKCDQKCNTSSADEFHAATNYRRKHPVLGAESESFEHIFSTGRIPKQKNVGTAAGKKNVKKGECLPIENLIETKKDVSRECRSVSLSIVDRSEHSSHSGFRTEHRPSSAVAVQSGSSKSSHQRSPHSFRRSKSRSSSISSPSSARQRSPQSFRRLKSRSSSILNRRSVAQSHSKSPSIIRQQSPHSLRRSRSSRSSIQSRHSVAQSRSKSPSIIRQQSTHSLRRSRSCRSSIQSRHSVAQSRSKSPSSVRQQSTHSLRRSRSSLRSSIKSRRSAAQSVSKSPSGARQQSPHSFLRSKSRSSSIPNRRSAAHFHNKSISSVRQRSPHSFRRSRSRLRSSIPSRRSVQQSRSKSPSLARQRYRHSGYRTSSKSRLVRRSRSTSPQHHSLQRQIKDLTKYAIKSYEHSVLNQRRIARMEVSVNKILVTMTDVRSAINSTNKTSSGDSASAICKIPKGFKEPDLPLEKLPQMISLNRNLMNAEFRLYLLTQEAYYCTASSQSDSVVMTAYLKRFITLKLRDQIHFKDAKGKVDEPILVRDFAEIYKFLKDVMLKGYSQSKRHIKEAEAHLAIRTVWGRTKQLLREQRQ